MNVPLHKRRKVLYCPNIYTVVTTKRPINNNRTCSTDCQLAGWSCSKIFYRKWKRQILSPFYPGVAFVEVLLQQLQPMLTTPRHKRWLQSRDPVAYSHRILLPQTSILIARLYIIALNSKRYPSQAPQSLNQNQGRMFSAQLANI